MSFAKSRVVVAVLVVFAMVIQFSSSVYAGRHRFDAPILDLLESCTDHMTFGFAYEFLVVDENGDIADPIYLEASIHRIDTGEEIFRTEQREPIKRLIGKDGKPLGDNGDLTAGILIDISGVSSAGPQRDIAYAKSDWLDYPDPDASGSSKLLKSPQNQRGYIVANYDKELGPDVQLSIEFNVTLDEDGLKPINNGNNDKATYSKDSLEGFELKPNDCNATQPADNLIHNPSFEEGRAPWHFYTDGAGAFTTSGPATDGPVAANVAIAQAGHNVQLYQKDLMVKPNTHYKVSFDAKSNSGHDLQLYLHKHDNPYINYGLDGAHFDLTAEYQSFTAEFTTKNFSAPVDDARLRFWLAPFATSGDQYMIDNVVLAEVVESDSLVANPGFEQGVEEWRFYTNGGGNFTATAPAAGGDAAAKVAISKAGSNVQLYQSGLKLEPNTDYKLTFDAMANNGQDMRVFIHKHDAPYTNYGLHSARIDLTSSYQTFTWSFTTQNFGSDVNDARLRFWLAPFANPGDEYMIDNVILQKVGDAVGAAAVGYPSGTVTVEADGDGLLAGGMVADDASTSLNNQIYLPIILQR